MVIHVNSEADLRHRLSKMRESLYIRIANIHGRNADACRASEALSVDSKEVGSILF